MSETRTPASKPETNYETKPEETLPANPEQTRAEARQARESDRLGEGRRRRVPLGVAMPKLAARVPEGMVGRWFNDVPGRIQRALDAGYEFISNDGETQKGRKGASSMIVGTNAAGGPLYAYLMAIPKEFYEEDQKIKQEAVDEIDAAIRHGVPQQADEKDRQQFYNPHGINTVESGTGKR